MAGPFLVSAALKSTVVLGAAWLCARLLRRRPAAERHLLWLLTAAAVILLPALSLCLPGWPVIAAPHSLTETMDLVFQTTVHGSSASASTDTKPAIAYRSFDWLILIWAAGTALALAQMLVGYAAVRRLRRLAQPFCRGALGAALSRSLGVRRRVEILQTAAGSMPMTCGILRPVILLPSDATRWSEERLRMVLLHELAHVRRRDVAMHFFARLAFSLYCWNPLAWVAWHELLKERERATDDLVLETGTRASDYAAELLQIAREMRPVPAMRWAAVGMMRGSQLEERLKAILDSKVRRSAPGRLATAICAVLAAAMLVPLAAVGAQNTARLSAGNERRPAANLISLGTAAILNRDLPRAFGYFEQASRADPGDAVAVMWMAVASEQQQNAAEAERLYQRALSMLDLESPSAAATIRLYSRFLRERSRIEEANALEARAAAVAKALERQNRPRTAGVHRIGGGVSPPKLLSKTEPEYSDEARAAKLAGRVMVDVEIGPDGLAHNARVVQPLGLGLDDAALRAIRQWRFGPGVKDGRPVTVAATVEINFRLI